MKIVTNLRNVSHLNFITVVVEYIKGKSGNNSGCDGDTGRRTVLGNSSFRKVNVDVLCFIEI